MPVIHLTTQSVINGMKPLIEEDIDKSNLADLTKVMYKSRLKTLWDTKGFPFDVVASLGEMNPTGGKGKVEKTGDAELRRAYGVEMTCINQILGIMRISNIFKNMIGGNDMEEHLLLYKSSITVGYEEATMKQKTREGDVDWNYLLSLKPQLEKNGISDNDKLIYHLYISPGIGSVPRNDFTPMLIVDDEKDTENTDFNYYCREKKEIILNQYKNNKKTKNGSPSDILPALRYKITDELNSLIPDRKYMFGNDETPMTENALQKSITRAFKKFAPDKNLTLNHIRRAWASKIEELPDGIDKAKASRDMGHNLKRNKAYAKSKE